MSKQWRVKERRHARLLDHLLLARGLEAGPTRENFLAPDYERDTHSPFLLKNIVPAAARILHALRRDETIVIFADYDADGVSAAAVLYDFFRRVDYQKVQVVIPDRNRDGYGLNLETIRRLAETGATLIITLDCGVANLLEVAEAQRLGLDVVIIDHHEPLGDLPSASAIINPKQANETYPYRELSAAALAWKMVQVLTAESGLTVRPGWEKWLLDLVALAAVADMVPLTGENRVLVHFGLKVLRRTRREGLKALSSARRLRLSTLSEDDVAFVLAPRVNLSGRMADAMDSFRLLTTVSVEEAETLVHQIEGLSTLRREAVEKIMSDLEAEAASGQAAVIVAGRLSWSPGVLGLAANRAVERYGRPVLLWGQGEGDAPRGSVRTDGSVSVVQLLQALPPGCLREFGGHAMAGGFTLSPGRVSVFPREVMAAYQSILKAEQDTAGNSSRRPPAAREADARLSLDELTLDLLTELESLAPFGPENPKPIFLFEKVELEKLRPLGEGRNHLRLDLRRPAGGIVSAMGFFSGRHSWGIKDDLSSGATIDCLAALERDTFHRGLRLRLEDVRLAS